PAALRAAARGVEVVYHLAAGQRMKPQFAAMSEDEIRAMNVAGTANVLAAARVEGVRKVVFVSSSGIYGLPTTVPVTEDHPQRPLGAYGRSKIEAERLCLDYAAGGGDVTMLRPMSLFGPHMTGVFVLLFDWVQRGKNVYLLGRGENRVQMVSADDVAEACRLAAETPAARGLALNLGADPVPTLRANLGRLDFPFKLTFCVTFWCNYRCTTCNIWKMAPRDELSLDEIRRFFARSGRFLWIDLTGGEVTLRKDFIDICHAVIDGCP